MAEKQTAVLQTNMGDIHLEFFPELAPKHVANFMTLAKKGFYDGTSFHRVIPGFMIQGGDPKSKLDDKSQHGTGGPGYTIKAEFNSKPHVRGILSMARTSDPDSAGSQFFIMLSDHSGASRGLDNQYTVFGQVSSGMDVVDKIAKTKTDSRDVPAEKMEITAVKVNEAPAT